MQIKNTPQRFGAVAGLYHWITATAFILSYPVVYYVIWVLDADRNNPLFRPVLNVHWVLGMVVGVLVIPRLIWRLTNTEPEPAPGTALEHRLSTLAHWGLYGLMISMPLTGYLGTGGQIPYDFYLFTVPKFPNTALFHSLNIDWKTFEPIMDAFHHFVGKWVAWAVVALHIAAAVYHHRVRHDTVLMRMLPPGIGKRQDRE